MIIEKCSQRERHRSRAARDVMQGRECAIIVGVTKNLASFVEAFEQLEAAVGKLASLGVAADVIMQHREAVPLVIEQSVFRLGALADFDSAMIGQTLQVIDQMTNLCPRVKEELQAR